jgi:hypothetical protein
LVFTKKGIGRKVQKKADDSHNANGSKA